MTPWICKCGAKNWEQRSSCRTCGARVDGTGGSKNQPPKAKTDKTYPWSKDKEKDKKAPKKGRGPRSASTPPPSTPTAQPVVAATPSIAMSHPSYVEPPSQRKECKALQDSMREKMTLLTQQIDLAKQMGHDTAELSKELAVRKRNFIACKPIGDQITGAQDAHDRAEKRVAEAKTKVQLAEQEYQLAMESSTQAKTALAELKSIQLEEAFEEPEEDNVSMADEAFGATFAERVAHDQQELGSLALQPSLPASSMPAAPILPPLVAQQLAQQEQQQAQQKQQIDIMAQNVQQMQLMMQQFMSQAQGVQQPPAPPAVQAQGFRQAPVPPQPGETGFVQQAVAQISLLSPSDEPPPLGAAAATVKPSASQDEDEVIPVAAQGPVRSAPTTPRRSPGPYAGARQGEEETPQL